jgi:hypothetical protein
VSLEFIGKLYYNFNPQTNYPSTLEKEVALCLEYLKRGDGEQIESKY